MLVGKPDGRERLVDLGVDWTIMLKWILQIGCGGMEWIHWSQNEIQW